MNIKIIMVEKYILYFNLSIISQNFYILKKL